MTSLGPGQVVLIIPQRWWRDPRASRLGIQSSQRILLPRPAIAVLCCGMKKIRGAAKTIIPDWMLARREREYKKETHINRALSRFGRDTIYVEIGVSSGECIRQIRARRRIAVEPFPVSRYSPSWDGVELHEVESDRYFDYPDVKPGQVNVALVDGLHEFRQTLRDVLNLEPLMHPKGVIFIHDCNPLTLRHQDDRTGAWNGDVWKVAHYLRTFRRDLNFVTLDCDWGLGVMSGFSGDPPPPQNDDIEATASLDYDFLNANRRFVLNLRKPLTHLLRNSFHLQRFTVSAP